MHERAVTESIIEIASRHAGNAGAKRITDIYLVIGDLSSIIDDSVQFYWDIVSTDTIAEGSRLHFRRIAARMSCLDCANEYPPGEVDFKCPNCGSTKIKILAGDEFYLESIEVD